MVILRFEHSTLWIRVEQRNHSTMAACNIIGSSLISPLFLFKIMDNIVVFIYDIHLFRQYAWSVFCLMLLYYALHSLMVHLSSFLTLCVRFIPVKGKKHHRYVMISGGMGLENI